MRRRTFLKAAGSLALGAVAPAVTGCSAEVRPYIVPTLEPIDTSRPHVRYRPIKGRGYGPDCLVAALDDMQRLDGVDGYVQVTIEEYGSGDGAIAVARAYPITYGTSPKAISLRVGPPVYADPAALAVNRPDDETGATVAERFHRRRRRSRPQPSNTTATAGGASNGPPAASSTPQSAPPAGP